MRTKWFDPIEPDAGGVSVKGRKVWVLDARTDGDLHSEAAARLADELGAWGQYERHGWLGVRLDGQRVA